MPLWSRRGAPQAGARGTMWLWCRMPARLSTKDLNWLQSSSQDTTLASRRSAHPYLQHRLGIAAHQLPLAAGLGAGGVEGGGDGLLFQLQAELGLGQRLVEGQVGAEDLRHGHHHLVQVGAGDLQVDLRVEDVDAGVTGPHRLDEDGAVPGAPAAAEALADRGERRPQGDVVDADGDRPCRLESRAEVDAGAGQLPNRLEQLADVGVGDVEVDAIVEVDLGRARDRGVEGQDEQQQAGGDASHRLPPLWTRMMLPATGCREAGPTIQRGPEGDRAVTMPAALR